MADGITNILVVGIGGQGVMTAAEMLARTAMEQGYDVKKTEVAGMAQRGGVVSSHVRFGPKVYSPQIDPGEADLLIGFEAAEGLRWLPHLRPAGIAMVNTLRLVPPVVSAGLYDYPTDPIAELASTGITVHAFDAGAIANELGNSKLVNTIMLGAISDYLPFPSEILKACIVEGFRAYKPKLADINAQAFDAGRAAGH
ncbi:MAG: indolepyruvate oxidoreductase subunit beta [Candidatus Competibacteraceae bacterium]|nr:indolepyruvate oxidoreductase subunit beta [Candidatus Competibacteraceae bacterium]MCP5459857.1 indolepyruvate oxidoreductase subunit beta [Gammaproteobacteria bacterium]MCB1770033.1 indolepyruvate oxidoreductase subunit beta [Candidatus Competibacteraceae bacterium]MCB1780044.1 indolepyruvate oxidoreductase subunit beta [Candidatus Competibacteraceae bacterium]HPF58585.1 indolepyruvate oxidoreductase subunit beta [Candidatus Competibacteraceae bacterium]